MAEKLDDAGQVRSVFNTAVFMSGDSREPELAGCLIALRQPMAEDLHHVVSPLKITTNIERFANYAKTMAL